MARRPADLPATLFSASSADPAWAIRAVDDIGLAAIYISAEGVVRGENRTWQRTAASGGLFAALRDGRDLVGAAAAAGIAPALLADLLVTATSGGSGQVEVSVPGPLGAAPRRYRLHTVAAARPPGGVILTCLDVTIAIGTEQRLQHESMHDRLTGLAHRDVLLSAIATALDAENERRHLVLYVDLDGLKHINDAHGHAIGDALLIEVGRRLSDDVCPGDVVARLGGDEFALLCCGVEDVADAIERAQRVHQLLTAPYHVAGRQLIVTASLGCRVTGLRPHETAESLLGEATEAMCQAKTAGRDGVALYSAEQHERSVRRSDMEWALASALATDQLQLVYQPQVSLETGKVLGVEALARWTSPELGVVPPEEFIRVAEGSRTILRLGDWVLNEACRQMAEWEAAGPAPGSITVNVSPMQLTASGFADTVASVLATHKLAAERLCLEITESALMDAEHRIIATLRKLRDLGVYLAIDDFGTGHSSLAQLRDLPVEVLKIDRSFVVGLDTDTEAAGFVTAILSLAHVLGLHVVAEGVETEGQVRELASRGCTVVQGMRYSLGVQPVLIPRLVRDGFRLPVERDDRGHRRRAGAQLRAASAEQLRGSPPPPRWATGRGCRLLVAELMYQLGLPEDQGK